VSYFRTVKHIEKRSGLPDVTCGCEYTTGARGQLDVWTQTCQEHEREFIARHAAAVASCSHANRDLVGS
jgi:hypothetical protein